MKEAIKAFRSSVRPAVAYIVMIAIAAIVWKLVGLFGNTEMAMMSLGSILGTGAAITGVYFGSRGKSPKS